MGSFVTFSRISPRADHPIFDLPPFQRRIITALWATYAIYYLGRLNLSAVLSVFEERRGLSAAQTGLIFSGYFWSYATGELIVGHLSDRISAARFVAGGLLASGLINLLYPSIDSLWALVALWCLNGFAQACGWAPGLKIVASVLDSQRASRVAAIYGTSFVVGTSVSWALAGILVDNVSLRSAFVVPGIILTAVGVVWLIFGGGIESRSLRGEAADPVHIASSVSLRLFGAAAAIGFAYVAFLVWTPTYFTEVNGLSSQRAGLAAATLPLISLVMINRISLIQRRTKSDRDLRGLAVISFVTSALLFVQAAAAGRAVLGSIVFVVAIAALTASASLMLGHAPVVLAAAGGTGGLAGRVGFFFSVGGGVGAFVVGSVKESFGWSSVFVTLGVAAFGAALLLTPLSREHAASQSDIAVP